MRKYGTTVYVARRWPLMLRLKGTVILQIWWQVLLLGIYSAAVFGLSKVWTMTYSLNLVSVMGMVVSLLLVFRTNTAYDRYWEGRRLWSQMTLCIRNLTRGIWVCVAESDTRDLLEKKSAINLLVAFAYSTKHYLREEYGYDYADLVDLLAHIPKYSVPTSTQPMDWRMDIPMSPTSAHTQEQFSPRPLSQHQSQPHQYSVNMEQMTGRPAGAGSPMDAEMEQAHTRRQSKHQMALAYDFLTPTNIPVELSYYIGSYIKSCSNKGKVDAATLTMMNNQVVSLVDCLGGFERILRTPIPLAYSIHLHHATWIYLLALPFQLVSNMGPFMILAVMLAAFTLLGILGIGYEIENPFNDDYNDLPLDDFCRVIEAEVDSMVAVRAPVPSEWIFSADNYPLSNSNLSAKELSELSLEEVHALMAAQANSGSETDLRTKKSKTLNYSRSVHGNQHTQASPSTGHSKLTRVESDSSSYKNKFACEE